MRSLVLLVFVLLVSAPSFAQYRFQIPHRKPQSDSSGRNTTKASAPKKSPAAPGSFGDRIYFGAGGGFGSGTNQGGLRYRYYSLLPTIGYRVKPQLLVGLNVPYSQYSFPDVIGSSSYNQLGFAPFVRGYVQQVFFQLEYDKISSNTLDSQTRHYYDRLFLGMGYAMPLGKRTALNAMGMYDVLYQQWPIGPFLTPFVFRVFFSY